MAAIDAFRTRKPRIHRKCFSTWRPPALVEQDQWTVVLLRGWVQRPAVERVAHAAGKESVPRRTASGASGVPIVHGAGGCRTGGREVARHRQQVRVARAWAGAAPRAHLAGPEECDNGRAVGGVCARAAWQLLGVHLEARWHAAPVQLPAASGARGGKVGTAMGRSHSARRTVARRRRQARPHVEHPRGSRLARSTHWAAAAQAAARHAAAMAAAAGRRLTRVDDRGMGRSRAAPRSCERRAAHCGPARAAPRGADAPTLRAAMETRPRDDGNMRAKLALRGVPRVCQLVPGGCVCRRQLTRYAAIGRLENRRKSAFRTAMWQPLG
mmetsp:Transcript_15063/g.50000  ORF Transcript_15063/g.50000 Transcript_15063/m.50000 type:complete len:326 (-) Transcript_15063:114-1091(-)